MNPEISVVSPVYGAADIVEELYARLTKELGRLTKEYEIILVNDACPQGSGEKIAELARRDKRVKLIDLSRNFGQHIAVQAGLDEAKGDYVVVMDCDLQDPPEGIAELYDCIKRNGADAVFSERVDRKEGFIKKFYSQSFKVVINALSDKYLQETHKAGNFSVLSRRVVDEVKKIKDRCRSYRGSVKLTGFPILYLPIEAQKRFAGESSYTLFRSLRLAWSIIMQQSARPLMFGGFCAAFSFALFIASAARYFAEKSDTPLILSALFFTATLLFACFAVEGAYLAAVLDEARGRPLYVVKRTINLERNKGNE